MNDTTEADTNFSATRTTTSLGGKDVAALSVTFGTPKRHMVLADLSLGDQFDLVELAGDNSENTRWMLMAGIAYAITDLDGMPRVRAANRRDIRANLEAIGEDGLSAYFKALKATAPAPQTADAVLDAAKNF